MNGCLSLFVVTAAAFALAMTVGAMVGSIDQRIKTKKMKGKMYISGPISGYDTDERMEAFGRASKKAETMGYKAVNPMADPIDGWEWDEYMRRDIAMLCKCDAIMLMSGWENSKGACLEKQIADALGMEMFYDIDVAEGGEE